MEHLPEKDNKVYPLSTTQSVVGIIIPEVRIVLVSSVNWPAYAATFGGFPSNRAPGLETFIEDCNRRMIPYRSIVNVCLGIRWDESLIQSIPLNHLLLTRAGSGIYFINGTVDDWKSFILTNAQRESDFNLRLFADAVMVVFECSELRSFFKDLIRKQLADKTFTVRSATDGH